MYSRFFSSFVVIIILICEENRKRFCTILFYLMSKAEKDFRKKMAPKRVFSSPTEERLYTKFSALKRNRKDLEVCKKEVLIEQERLEKFQKLFPDKVSQQENVLIETKAMVPDAENRLRSAIMDITDFLEKERDNLPTSDWISEVHPFLIEVQKDVRLVQ